MKLHRGEARIGGRGVDHSTRVIFGNSLLVYLLLAPPFPAAGGRPAACRGASSPRSLGRGAGTLPFPRRALPAVTGEASSLDPKQPAAPSAGAHQLEQPPPAGGNINTRRWGFFPPPPSPPFTFLTRGARASCSPSRRRSLPGLTRSQHFVHCSAASSSASVCGEGPGEARAVPARLYHPARSPHGWGGFRCAPHVCVLPGECRWGPSSCTRASKTQMSGLCLLPQSLRLHAWV